MPAYRRVSQGLLGAIGSPIYLALASRRGLPGVHLRWHCARLAAHAVVRHPAMVSAGVIYRMLFRPLDSTRYFEFDFMWRALRDRTFTTYLDVSSPRLLPLLVLSERNDVTATLLNPDRRDLEETACLVKALGLGNRCELAGQLLETAHIPAGRYDLITCMSVLEHIRHDSRAVASMWDALKPGGRLLLSMPCAATAEEQFVNIASYDFVQPDADGLVFFQYLYDDALLAERVYSITGSPARWECYGEKQPGAHRRLYEHKWAAPSYPFWKEPWLMSLEFQRYDSIASLPGEGVALLEFVK
jgi:SAM-dependent methyltransferase